MHEKGSRLKRMKAFGGSHRHRKGRTESRYARYRIAAVFKNVKRALYQRALTLRHLLLLYREVKSIQLFFLRLLSTDGNFRPNHAFGLSLPFY
jgi:hypothetical protein